MKASFNSSRACVHPLLQEVLLEEELVEAEEVLASSKLSKLAW